MNRMRAFWIAAVFFTTVAAHAAFEFDPIAPTDRSFIQVNVRDMWYDGCLPHSPTMTRNGSSIEILFRGPGQDQGCPLMVSEWTTKAPIGVLPAGVYDVVLKAERWGNISTVTTMKLIVTESAPAFPVHPRVVSSDVATKVQITLCRQLSPPDPFRVFVDGVEVPATAKFCTIEATVPPHAPGPVNVRVVAESGTREVINAIHYVDPAAAPEASLYERVLVPIVYSGQGAFGSQWETETILLNREPHTLEFLHDVSDPLSRVTSGANASLSIFGNRPSGLVLFPPRGASVHFGSLVRDRSREDSEFGAEVRIIRERDTAPVLVLPNVPFDPRYRVQLRIYDIDGMGGWVGYDARTEGAVAADSDVVELTAPCEDDRVPCNSNQPGYASVDLAREFDALNGRYHVTVRAGDAVRRLWAFVTVTNNETQRVTVITPQ